MWQAISHCLLLSFLISLLFLTLCTSEIKSVLVYYCQTLLDLRQCVNSVSTFSTWEHKIFSKLSGTPAHLCQAPALPSQGKCHRRTGRRSGRLVRLKDCMLWSKCFRTVPVMFPSVFLPWHFSGAGECLPGSHCWCGCAPAPTPLPASA